jgi:hypothetical protein
LDKEQLRFSVHGNPAMRRFEPPGRTTFQTGRMEDMRPYFEKMQEFGSALKPGIIKSREPNVKLIKDVEAEVDQAVEKVKNVGLPTAEINKRRQLTVWQRLEYLLDSGSWTPLTSTTAWPRSPANGPW